MLHAKDMHYNVEKRPPTRSKAAINPTPSDSLTAPDRVVLTLGAGCVGAAVGAIVVPNPEVVVPLPPAGGPTLVPLVGTGCAPVLAAVTLGIAVEGLK